MDEYINRDGVLSKFNIDDMWAHIGGDEWCCPVCGFVITTEGSWDKPTKKYCEDCGTKMNGAE